MERELPGTEVIIHLACISNDPSYELDPQLAKSINYDAFLQLIEVAKQSGSPEIYLCIQFQCLWH